MSPHTAAWCGATSLRGECGRQSRRDGGKASYASAVQGTIGACKACVRAERGRSAKGGGEGREEERRAEERGAGSPRGRSGGGKGTAEGTSSHASHLSDTLITRVTPVIQVQQGREEQAGAEGAPLALAPLAAFDAAPFAAASPVCRAAEAWSGGCGGWLLQHGGRPALPEQGRLRLRRGEQRLRHRLQPKEAPAVTPKKGSAGPRTTAGLEDRPCARARVCVCVCVCVCVSGGTRGVSSQSADPIRTCSSARCDPPTSRTAA
jgi:hypothetical protein